MKGLLDRTKVVLRHLPPSISKDLFVNQVDSVFAGRYNWLFFRPAKTSQKSCFSRAYIDFKQPDDVVEFAEFFKGHVFVNEKGIQFRTMVEYAPSQRVPKLRPKTDCREGTIDKDPEYLEFLELLAKPAEYLPSAEIQLERREAERAGAGKDPPIVTPLMDFVRQKRAAKGGSRRSLPNGKSTRKGSGLPAGSSNSALTRRGADKRRNSTKMYVLKDAVKNTTGRDKTKHIIIAKRENQTLSEKSTLSSVVGAGVLEESGGQNILLHPGKETERTIKRKRTRIRDISTEEELNENLDQQMGISAKHSIGSPSVKQNQRRGRIVKSILQNKNVRQNHLSTQFPDTEKEKQHLGSQHGQLSLQDTNGVSNYKVVRNEIHVSHSDKSEKRTRNKDRLDRGVWAPRHLPDGSIAIDESSEGIGGVKVETANTMSGSSSPLALDNGFCKPIGRRRPLNNVKDGDVLSEGKHSRRGGSLEKQVWVQKSSSGS